MTEITVNLDEIEIKTAKALVNHGAKKWIADEVANAVRVAEAEGNKICGLYYLESYCNQLKLETDSQKRNLENIKYYQRTNLDTVLKYSFDRSEIFGDIVAKLQKHLTIFANLQLSLVPLDIHCIPQVSLLLF